MVTSPSLERVSALLARLRADHRGFHIQQTTVSVSGEEYDRAVRDGGGVAEVRVRVCDDGQVLLAREGRTWVEPGGSVGARTDGGKPNRARRVSSDEQSESDRESAITMTNGGRVGTRSNGGDAESREEDDFRLVARRLVEEETGVRCTVEDLQRASIVCVYDEDDPQRPPFYRLTAHFDGSYEAGEPQRNARWQKVSPVEPSALF